MCYATNYNGIRCPVLVCVSEDNGNVFMYIVQINEYTWINTFINK